MITLRPYQREAIEAVKRDWGSGFTDVLITTATGGGKTAMFLSLLHEVLQPGQRALILAHRKELIDQPAARMVDYYPDWQGRIGIVMAEQREVDKQIIVATVQTLAVNNYRLAEIVANGAIDYLVTDEAHHFSKNNKSYANTLEYLKRINPNLKHLGVTATPIRADGDGLSGVYQKESAHYGIVELIKLGYLANVRFLAIETNISLAEVKTVAGDFQASGLSEAYETDRCFDIVVNSHKQYAQGRQAIAFSVTVDGAFMLAEKFNQAGIIAKAACGKTDKKERTQTLDDFRAGRTQVLCNVGLYTEGLDVPEVSCIHQVRPTKSDGLYTQMIGRALRLFPGKEDALILDYMPVEKRNIAMLGDVLGIPIDYRAIEKAKKEKEYEQDVLFGFTFDKFGSNFGNGSPLDIISRQLHYLDVSVWHWYRKDGYMSLGLGKATDEIERTLVITPPQEGKVKLVLCAKRPGEFDMKGYPVMQDEVDKCLAWCDEYANKRGNASLAAKARTWHNQLPSEAQEKFAKRLKGVWEQGIMRGELAQRITHHLAIQAAKRVQ